MLARSALPTLIGLLGDASIRASLNAAFTAIGVDAVEPLLIALESGTREARVAAAAVLGRLGDARAVPGLIARLDAADAELSATAAGALAALGDPRAVDGLLALFAHPRATVRQAAVAAINAIGAATTGAEILVRLGDANPRVRECAIRVAGYFGFDNTVSVIVERTADEDEEVRRASIEQLPVLQHPRAHMELAAAMAGDTPRNRAAAAHAAGFADDPVTEQALVMGLADIDPWVRYFAAGSIARRQITSAATALEQLALHDPATHVRIAAMHALGTIDAPHLPSIAVALLRDGDSDLAAAAMAAVSSVTDPHVDELLEEAARSSAVARRIPAIHALAARPRQRSVEVLAWAACIGDPPELRSSAIEGLGRLAASATDVAAAAVEALLALSAEREGHDEALAALATLPATAVDAIGAALAAGQPPQRVAAVEALARMRHPAASAALTRALDDPTPVVRAAAVSAFGRLGTRAVGPVLATMQQADPDVDVRRKAAVVCARYGWGTPR